MPVDHTFTLSNLGAVSATAMAEGSGLAMPFGFKSGAYPGGGTCGATLGTGASCTVVVTFTPSGTGASSATLSVAYNDGAAATGVTRAVTGTSTSLALLMINDWQGGGGGGGGSPPPFDYGTSGVPIDHTFTLQNIGKLNATALASLGGLGTSFAFKGAGYPGTGGSCSGTLAPGSSCAVVWKPT